MIHSNKDNTEKNNETSANNSSVLAQLKITHGSFLEKFQQTLINTCYMMTVCERET